MDLRTIKDKIIFCAYDVFGFVTLSLFSIFLVVSLVQKKNVYVFLSAVGWILSNIFIGRNIQDYILKQYGIKR